MFPDNNKLAQAAAFYAIALGLVGFLATVAFARFVLERGMSEGDRETGERNVGERKAGAK